MRKRYDTKLSFDDFADKRLAGAEKITKDSKEKGGTSMLTYYHYNAKLPFYKEAAEGEFNIELAKKEFNNLKKMVSYDMPQIEFQKVMGEMEVLVELIIKQKTINLESKIKFI